MLCMWGTWKRRPEAAKHGPRKASHDIFPQHAVFRLSKAQPRTERHIGAFWCMMQHKFSSELQVQMHTKDESCGLIKPKQKTKKTKVSAADQWENKTVTCFFGRRGAQVGCPQFVLGVPSVAMNLTCLRCRTQRRTVSQSNLRSVP